MKRLFVVTLFALSVASVSALGQWSDNPSVNTPVSTAPGIQNVPRIAGDGAGGAIIVWKDQRGTFFNIYAQRLSAAGVALWTTNGVPVCTADSNKYDPVIVSDGVGGAIIVWMDSRNGHYDIYGQRINANGVVQWVSNGVAICTAAGNHMYPSITGDGASGVIVTWQDSRSKYYDVYAQRINASGSPQWTPDGIPVSIAPLDQLSPVIAGDGAGGAIITWMDFRNGTDYDIFAQRVTAAGTLVWGNDTTGDTVCVAASDQSKPAIIGDGTGGAIITWADARTDTGDIYAQRLNASGMRQWDPAGVAVCLESFLQNNQVLVSDGAGGAIIAWEDSRSNSSVDIYAQLIDSSGTPHWNLNGTPVCTAAADQANTAMIPEGNGGALVTWMDSRPGFLTDVYAQRLNAAGVALWTPDGVPVSNAAGNQLVPLITASNAGGGIITWWDSRTGGSNSDIYAQMISGNGALGDGTVSIQSVRDVRNDQGGFVNVLWNPSPYDIWPDQTITSYEIFRGVNPNSTLPVTSPGPEPSFKGLVISPRTSSSANPSGSPIVSLKGLYWQSVGVVKAENLPGYAFAALTLSDSTALGLPFYYFMVRANTSNPEVFWDSPIDSGYSVDNLPPAVVAHVAGLFAAGTETLHWNANTEKDLAGYLVFRSSSPGFDPTGTTPYATTTDTQYVDANAGTGGVFYYAILAADIHGNKSGKSNEISTISTGVDGTSGMPTVFALGQNFPNPFNPSTMITYDVPQTAVVRLTVYDLLGRTVAELVNGQESPGRHRVEWNAGTMSSGIYYVRMVTQGFVATRKLMLMK